MNLHLALLLAVLQSMDAEARKELTPIKLRKKAAQFAMKTVDQQRKAFKVTFHFLLSSGSLSCSASTWKFEDAAKIRLRTLWTLQLYWVCVVTFGFFSPVDNNLRMAEDCNLRNGLKDFEMDRVERPTLMSNLVFTFPCFVSLTTALRCMGRLGESLSHTKSRVWSGPGRFETLSEQNDDRLVSFLNFFLLVTGSELHSWCLASTDRSFWSDDIEWPYLSGSETCTLEPIIPHCLSWSRAWGRVSRTWDPLDGRKRGWINHICNFIQPLSLALCPFSKKFYASLGWNLNCVSWEYKMITCSILKVTHHAAYTLSSKWHIWARSSQRS